MSELSRIALLYTGGDADRHQLVGQELGKSLSGASRLYEIVAQALITGRVPGSRTALSTRILVGPPSRGSLATDIFVMTGGVVATAGPILIQNPEIIKEGFSALLDWAIKAMKGMWAGDSTAMSDAQRTIDNCVAVMDKMSERQDAENARLHETTRYMMEAFHRMSSGTSIEARLNTLADAARPAAKLMVEPVGRSCESCSHTVAARNIDSTPIVYDQATADAIRVGPATTIGDMQDFLVFVTALDKETSSAKVEFDAESPIFKAKINDPALEPTNNVYSRALDNGTRIRISAKPVLNENGEIKYFYIMDATEADS